MTWDNRGRGQPGRDRYGWVRLGWGDNVRGALDTFNLVEVTSVGLL